MISNQKIIGILAIFIVTITSFSVSAKETIRIGYIPPWSAGLETIRSIKKLPHSIKKIELIATDRKYQILALNKAEFNIVLLGRNQWFNSLSKNPPFIAVAEIGPYLAVVNKAISQSKTVALTEFLKTWQKRWLELGYPYGVQPPIPSSLAKNYKELLEGIETKKPVFTENEIEKYTKKLIPLMPVTKWNPSKVLTMTAEFYRSYSILVKHSINAVPGKTYKGRVLGLYEKHLELDRDPCERSMVNFRDPYMKRDTGNTVTCEKIVYKIYNVTQED